uniref:Uncharacterized protein n=1 Tax=Sciurus vulgaris TaxID=55149 RepID=A0A8D2DT58_SCIVU
MALPLSFLLALVVLSCKSTCSLGCDLPRIHHLDLELLKKMRRIISILSCVKYRKDFAFPKKQLDGEHVQKAQAVAVFYEMTQQVFNLFSTQESFAAWNKTLLNSFLRVLYQQLDDLKACVTQQVEVEEAPKRTVKKYFRRLTDYLKEKTYLPCAWEVVRATLVSNLQAPVPYILQMYLLSI